MLALLGIILVFAAVLGGFLLERGNPFVLLQPAEILIIVGAACGIVLVANPWTVIRKMGRGAFLAWPICRGRTAGAAEDQRRKCEILSNSGLL